MKTPRTSLGLFVLYLLICLSACSAIIGFINNKIVLPSDELRQSTNSVYRNAGVSFVTKSGINLVADVYLPA